jgi:hypothetical protein
MKTHLHPDVEEIRDSPERGEDARLVLVVDEDHEQAVADDVRDVGRVEETPSSGVIVVTLPQQAVRDLCLREDIRSISPDDELRVLS